MMLDERMRNYGFSWILSCGAFNDVLGVRERGNVWKRQSDGKDAQMRMLADSGRCPFIGLVPGTLENYHTHRISKRTEKQGHANLTEQGKNVWSMRSLHVSTHMQITTVNGTLAGQRMSI